MNDFSELENELKQLRPVQPSPDLAARVERALAETGTSTSTAGIVERPRRFQLNWWPLGLGLAGAAALLLFAWVSLDRTPGKLEKIATSSPAPNARSTIATDQFVPAGATQVLYRTRDEGLLFADGAGEPVRRLRYQTRETWQWRNPGTGASLRVSYPSEEVVLVPVSGQ